MTERPASPAAGPAPLAPRRSRAWSVAFRAMYRLLRLLDPLIASWIANGLPGLDGVVDMRYPGRRTGRPRRTLVTILRHGGAWYVGHPNGPAAWVRNIEAAGWVEVDPPAAHGARFAVVRLEAGPERDAVIRAACRQQPFPANLIYRAAQRHIAAVGVYHRLEPVSADPPSSIDEGAR